MTLESLLKDYAAYNLWANTEIVHWLKAKPAELMERKVPSSFSSVRDTLIHIWGAEEIWVERMKQIPTHTFLSFRFNGSLEDLFAGLPNQSSAFAAYVQDLSDHDFQEVCSFKLLNGAEDSRSRVKMIHHCMNHSTYHRGQIVTIAHHLGLTDPPSTDYMKYIRVK